MDDCCQNITFWREIVGNNIERYILSILNFVLKVVEESLHDRWTKLQVTLKTSKRKTYKKRIIIIIILKNLLNHVIHDKYKIDGISKSKDNMDGQVLRFTRYIDTFEMYVHTAYFNACK